MENIEGHESFMEVLEELREVRGIGKKEIAIRANISPSYMTHLTTGARTTPSEKVVHSLAEVLELSVIERVRLFKAAGYAASAATLFTSKSRDEDSWCDWGEAPHIRMFCGREKEVEQLRQWILVDHCQVVALLGIGGAGKTMLATYLAEKVVSKDFDYILWRSLQHAPRIEKILQEAIYLFSERQPKASLAIENLADDIDGQIALLIDYLQANRCLLVLDNFESVLEGKDRSGNYREGYEKYGKLLQRMGEVKHRSCLLLTSREKPGEMQRIEGKASHARSILLGGVAKEDARLILEEKELQGTDKEWAEFIDNYSGNPLALKLVAESIRALFDGAIGAFLRAGETVFGGIHQLLDEQFSRLSSLESTIMYWLAIERQEVLLDELEMNLAYPVSKRELLEAIEALLRRSMIEVRKGASFTLQPVIMEYCTDRFVEEVYSEIEQGKMSEGLFFRHALMKARAKDYIRDYQVKLILKPIAERLLTTREQSGSEKKLKEMLGALHKRRTSFKDYAAGNILNLLVYLNVDLRGYDFSHLPVRQAYLQGVSLLDVNFTGADLSESAFTDTFGSIFAVALSTDGKLLAAGTANGEIRLWDTATAIPRTSLQGHNEWVRSVTFSPDGAMLASGSEDQTVRIWNVHAGKCLRILYGHTSRVYSVAYSPDGRKVVSGSDDRTVRIWDVESGNCLMELQEHEGRVYSVAFHPEGNIIASGSFDGTVRLWQASTGECLAILHGHTSRVRTVAFSDDGCMLASGSGDQTVRLWDTGTHKCFKILQGHTDCVWSVAFSPDGQTIASGSDDQTIRVWDIPSAQCRRILQRYEKDEPYGNTAYSIVFSANGNMIASGCDGQIVRLWDARNGECLKTLRGHGSRVYAVAFSPEGNTIVGGYEDKTVRLWDVQDVQTSESYRTLQAHDHWVWSVTFSPDGSMFVSGSEDKRVRLWKTATGEHLMTFAEHANRVYSVAFSPKGDNLIASSSGDQMVKLWQAGNEACIRTFSGHKSRVYSVAFSPSGTMLVSGSDDQTMMLWDINTGRCLRVFDDRVGRVRSVAFSPDEQRIAEGSEDATIKIWHVLTGDCLMNLQGHTGWVRSVAFSPDGRTIASGSEDGTVKLWDAATGTCHLTLKGEGGTIYAIAFHPSKPIVASGCLDGTIKLWNWHTGRNLQILRSDRPYERMKITGIKGLKSGQKAILKALGAIED